MCSFVFVLFLFFCVCSFLNIAWLVLCDESKGDNIHKRFFVVKLFLLRGEGGRGKRKGDVEGEGEAERMGTGKELFAYDTPISGLLCCHRRCCRSR